MYLRLDQDLANFLQFLDKKVGDENYSLFLSADHGGAHNASFLIDNKIPAGTLSEKKIAQELNVYLKTAFKNDSLVLSVMNYQVRLNEDCIKKYGLNRQKIKSTIISYCEQYEAIARVIDLENLTQTVLPASLKELIQNGYYPSRCGSLALIFQPAWYSDGKKGTTHGTWNPYDTHIPLLWYGWGIPHGESFKRYNVTDIAATLAAILHIQVPNGCVAEAIYMDK
jgi:arylsulfatase A-like enzyme